MRELTKSMLRFSWALPLLGFKQMTNLSLPTEANLASARQAFDTVTDAAQRELGSTFQGFYEAGDRLQSGLVDAMMAGCSFDAWNPASWMPGVAQTPPKSSTGGESQASGATGTTASASQQSGWGPIPGS